MDVQAVATRVVGEIAPPLDGFLSEHLRELVAVGEWDIALMTLIEDAPQAVAAAFVDEVEAHYRDSGEYVEREALNAVGGLTRYSGHRS